MMHPIHLKYGNRTFVVELIWSDRKRLTITVHPDLHITAKAPAGYELEDIRRRLEKKSSWIARQIEYFEQFHPLPPERKYVSGETHFYLGRQYRLRIRSGKKVQVRLMGRFFEMELPDPNDREKAEKAMRQWYALHAKNLLSRRLSQFMPVFEDLGVSITEVRCRRMKKRWGSCSSKEVILLNTELVKAPIHCIDYVIVHELCHLRHPRHDKIFYRLLDKIMPDWRKRKERLEHVVI